MVQLYLNGKLCDLYGNETIATDYSIAPISDITSRTTAKSISFRIPLTANNRAIIDNTNVIVNDTTLPYRFIPAQLHANGLDQNIEFAQIKSIKDDIEIVLFGSNIDFFSVVKERRLADLGDVWNHHWTLANAFASRNNTSGYIYAMIDYHSDTPHVDGYLDNTNAKIDVRGLLPSVYLHSIISEIIAQAGFEAQGEFLDNADYRSVVIPAFPPTGEFNSTVTHTFTATTTEIVPLFVETGFAGVTLQKGSTVTITGGNQSITLVTHDDTILADTPVINRFNLLHPASSTGLVYYNGTDNTSDPATVSGLHIGQVYTVRMDLNFINTNESGNIITVYGVEDTTPHILNAFTIGKDFGASLHAANLPDLRQSDLLKDSAQKFGLIFQVDHAAKTVHIRQFSEIIANISNALDWSDKVDYTEQPELQFDSNYAQRNLCTYKEDATVLKPSGTDSPVTIENENLQPEKELFQSPFAASEQAERFGGVSIAQIKLFTDLGGEDEEIADVEPRYLVKRNETFSVFTYTDSATDLTAATVPVTHFILPGQPFNAGFEDNLLDNSAQLIEMIRNYKTVTMLLRLTAADINQLDFFRPVWIELKGQPGCYYYVSRIKQFKVTATESTEVELVKLP